MKGRKKMIFDTDVGVDDLCALELLQRSEMVELLCVTVVHGNIGLETALRTLELFVGGTHVEVFAGAKRPLIKAQEEVVCWPGHGVDGCGGKREELGRLVRNNQGSVQRPHGANAAAELVKRSGADVTCVCVGPLTNLATAVLLCPTLEFERVVIMGGTVHGKGNTTHGSEFNFHADPEAAAIALRHFGSRVVLVPWECTVMAPLPWKVLEESPVLALMLDKYREIALESGGELILCDLVAAAVALDDSIIKKSHHLVPKVLLGGDEAGTVLWDWYGRSKASPADKVHVVEEVDVERYAQMCQFLFQWKSPAGFWRAE